MQARPACDTSHCIHSVFRHSESPLLLAVSFFHCHRLVDAVEENQATPAAASKVESQHDEEDALVTKCKWANKGEIHLCHGSGQTQNSSMQGLWGLSLQPNSAHSLSPNVFCRSIYLNLYITAHSCGVIIWATFGGF